MNIDICKRCKKIYFYVVDDSLKGVDKKPHLIYRFNCGGNWDMEYWFLSDKRLLEAYVIDNNKGWKLIQRNKYWFKFFKKRFINNQFKKEKCFKDCPYYMEHKLSDWNKKK